MPVIRSFRELQVYQLARTEAREIFNLTRCFPREEQYSLTDQVRRSSRAVGAMLAEAWARRRYIAAFVSKLDDALGEAMETQAWLDHALDCGYINAEEHAKLDAGWQTVGAKLQRMMDRADTFCPSATARP
jgi:four helix bundle protein